MITQIAELDRYDMTLGTYIPNTYLPIPHT